MPDLKPVGWVSSDPANVVLNYDTSEKYKGAASMRIDLSGEQALGSYVYREFPIPIAIDDFPLLFCAVRAERWGIPVRLFVDTANTGVSSGHSYDVEVDEKDTWLLKYASLADIPVGDTLRTTGIGYLAFEIRETAAMSIWVDALHLEKLFDAGDAPGLVTSMPYLRVLSAHTWQPNYA